LLGFGCLSLATSVLMRRPKSILPYQPLRLLYSSTSVLSLCFSRRFDVHAEFLHREHLTDSRENLFN
jgi:hypothetical protein